MSFEAKSRAWRDRFRIFAFVAAEGLKDGSTFVPEVVGKISNNASGATEHADSKEDMKVCNFEQFRFVLFT
jgi:hypothetical protein